MYVVHNPIRPKRMILRPQILKILPCVQWRVPLLGIVVIGIYHLSSEQGLHPGFERFDLQRAVMQTLYNVDDKRADNGRHAYQGQYLKCSHSAKPLQRPRGLQTYCMSPYRDTSYLVYVI